MEEKGKQKKVILLLIILLLLFIIFFLLIKQIGVIEHVDPVPTGNVDIFDINFQVDCGCDCDIDSPNTDENCNNCNDNSKPVKGKGNVNSKSSNSGNNNIQNNTPNESNTPSNEDKKLTGVEIYDDETTYTTKTKLNIFTQTSYSVIDNKIAPGSENSYQFIIRNNNDFNIKYNLEMLEKNDYNINMKYRLKLNDKYVVGSDDEYVSANELAQYDIGLANNNRNVYTLDWKWIESSNDTKIGTSINANYQLNLKITAYAN